MPKVIQYHQINGCLRTKTAYIYFKYFDVSEEQFSQREDLTKTKKANSAANPLIENDEHQNA